MNGTQAYVLSRKQFSSLGTAAYKDVGVANGVAELDDAGIIPSSQLPSFVDDVIEYDSYNDFPIIGESGKIYLDKSTNKSYRWAGTTYAVVGSDLALGETSATAYRGDRGKIAYDHSQLTSGNPHHVTKDDVGLGNVDNKSSATIRSELTKSNVTTALGYTPPTTDTNTTYVIAEGESNGQIKVTPSTGNPYNVPVKGLAALAYKSSLSKSDVGLGNVENKSSATIRSELTKSNVTTALGYTPPTTDTNTTYSFSEGSTNGSFVVTPSSGSASTVKVHGLGSLAYKNSLSKSDVGLGNVDNTADANKSVNYATYAGNADYVTNAAPIRFKYKDSQGIEREAFKMGTSKDNGVRIIDPIGLMVCDNANASPSYYTDMTSVTCSVVNVRGRHKTGEDQYSAAINFANSATEIPTSKASIKFTGNDLLVGSDLGYVTVEGGTGTKIQGTDLQISSDKGYIVFKSALRTLDGLNGFYIRDDLGLGVVKASNSSVFSDIYCAVLHDGASSLRFKENIHNLTADEAKKILDIRTVTFDFKHDSGIIDNARRLNHRGVIAEEVEKIIPSVVSYKPDENGDHVPYSVQYSKFVPYLIKMIQMQQEEINELKAKIN